MLYEVITLSTANASFNYVVEKGPSFPYYNNSRFALLNVMYQQIMDNQITTQDELSKVEEQYKSVISELAISNTTVDLIIELAHIQAFYLKKEQSAVITSYSIHYTKLYDILTESPADNMITPQLSYVSNL